MPASQFDLPASITSFRGQINDIDSHENVPLNLWREHFGSIAQEFVDAILDTELKAKGIRASDDTEINSETVWKRKLEQAPGAWDFDRRLQVMDFTGVKRQIVYPGLFGGHTLNFYAAAGNPNAYRKITGDRAGYARQLHRAYNDWCARLSRKSDRLRPAALLIEETPQDFLASAKQLVSEGVRAFWMLTDRPPAGLSPADPALDPLWQLLAASDSTLLTHVGGHEGILKSLAWREAPAFEGWKIGDELRFDPWSLANVHLGVQTFLTTMVLGGVFERHPKLRFGCAELTGHWVGPMAENMDNWMEHKPFPNPTGASALRLKPSEYVRRNIRVACFDFEPIGRYIERFGLEEVYAYASDFPHHEGGKDPMGDFTRSLSGHGPEVLHKFFVSNGALLLPD
jgi:predicted TIM-barrel fold metal-dependent hydrolase